MKYFILDKEKLLNDVLSYLIDKLGLPSIKNRLNIYSDNDFQIQILNNKVYFKHKKSSKFLIVKNKNLKHFFNFVQSKNTNGFMINDISLLEFKDVNILFNTYHGNIMSVNDDILVEDIIQKFNIVVYNDISDHKIVCQMEREFLFDNIGNLNTKIKAYSHKVGLDIRSSSSSVRLRLSNISNNYSYLENYYKLITNNELLSFSSNFTHKDKFQNISIIIPVYNQNIVATLLSIQGQNISKANKQKIQVVIVDDGSTNNVEDEINCIIKLLDFEINVISFKQNMGISNARNAGVSIAKYDLLLFMDSDIILSKNYIYDINMRLQIIPNAIFVAMRKNVDRESEYTVKENLLKGIDPCYNYDDSRVITESKKYHIGWDKAFQGEEISILDDTDYFKDLSFGSKVGIYDISTVVTGHNMAINKSLVCKYPLFSTQFKGWGMEDAYFASTLISNGCHVIPVLSSCVFHINHPPKSGSVEQKTLEAKKNVEIYNKMIDEKWE